MTGKLKPYPRYKDSGVEWLGDVPEHWVLDRIKSHFQIEKRISGSLDYDVLSITQKGIVVKDIDSGEGQLSMDYSKYQLIFKGEFGMNHMDLLTGYIDISKYNGVVSPDYRVFSIKNQIFNTNFYLYVFQTFYINKIFYKYGQGSSQLGRWRLPSEEFYGFRIPTPSPDEQITISNYLDKQTAKIDQLIENYQKLIVLSKKKIIALALNEQIAGNGAYEKLSHLVRLIERPVDVKNNTEYEALGLYNRGRGLFHKPKTLGKDLGESDFFYVKCGDLILSGQFSWEGAVAMANQSENNCIVSHRYPIIKGKKIMTEYLYALLMTEYGDFLLNESSRGAAGRNRPLNINLLLNEKIRVPSQLVQEEIYDLLIVKTNLERNIIKATDLLKEKRTALITAAVTGKVDVREYA
ncbi:restriction endonuclease subunit S [Facilibium subflavum]|uniref:restriction endonuclease subunit S n=1 Tax=Facilibium subflavum TaxID=2219058 RepID=UPI000E65DD29|nr:restriction endonuclease subunit S [Facilibium subflavum]